MNFLARHFSGPTFMAALLLACLGTLAFTHSADAEIPAVGFKLHEKNVEISGTLISLDSVADTREFIQGFTAEVKKIREKYPSTPIQVHWLDVDQRSLDRGLADLEESAEGIAASISDQNDGIEIEGHRIAEPPRENLTPEQLRYVRNSDRFAYIMRVGVIGGMESVHLFLTHGVPVWIPASAGVVTAAAMLFNTANTEKISNLVTYRKWKSLSSEEIVRINEAFAASSVRTKLLRGPKILFMATLYEIAFQGSVQGLIQGLFYLGNATHEFDIWKFLVAIGVGSIGESAFDAAQSAYQETRGASVPHAIRKANMMRIGTLASILSVLGTLKSSDGVLASEILLGTMVTTGISLNFYFRNTDRIKEVVLPVALGLETRTRDFLTGVRGLFKTAAKRSCDFLSRRNNDIGAP